MIDFDDLDTSDTHIIARVAHLDPAGCPRGECNCCDCLEWLGSDDAWPARMVQTHAYNVIRRWDDSALSIGAELQCPLECLLCSRCGCHAIWHEDLSEQMSHLLGKGALVEADPEWTSIERALFCQTSGVFIPRPADPGQHEQDSLWNHDRCLEEKKLASTTWDTIWDGKQLTVRLLPDMAFWTTHNVQGCWALTGDHSSEVRLSWADRDCVMAVRNSWRATLLVPPEPERIMYRRPQAKAGQQMRCEALAKHGEILMSVICPTSRERQHFHPILYHWFSQQRYPAKELIIVDTGGGISNFFADGPPSADPRIIYRWFPEDGPPWSIGAKRNLACYLASGTVIVHFDDDDLYGPLYLENILKALTEGCQATAPGLEVRVADEGSGGEAQDGGQVDPNPPLRFEGFSADAATLSAWHTFDLAGCLFRMCDVDRDHEGKRDWTFGYGFSFAYLRDAWQAHPFRDVNWGEDIDFLESLLARGARVALLKDRLGLCAHVHHKGNFSQWEEDNEMPQPGGETGQCLVQMGKALRSMIMPGKVRIARTGMAKPQDLAGPLTRRTAAAMQIDLIAEMTKEDFQTRLREAYAATYATPARWKSEQRRICLEVQGPVIARYGFENSFEGVLRSTAAFTPEVNADLYISRRSDFIHWLCNPELQAHNPMDEAKVRQHISDLCKSAKARRRRE